MGVGSGIAIIAILVAMKGEVSGEWVVAFREPEVSLASAECGSSGTGVPAFDSCFSLASSDLLEGFYGSGRLRKSLSIGLLAYLEGLQSILKPITADIDIFRGTLACKQPQRSLDRARSRVPHGCA